MEGKIGTGGNLEKEEDARAPVVSVIIGFESDRKVMGKAADTLKKFGIPHEEIVISHHTPEELYEYTTNVKKRGLKMMIAGAGAAPELPGVFAVLTELHVVGVPLESRSLSGLGSLLSMVQVPQGVTVTTMAINGAENAALFAADVLASEDEELAEKLAEHRKEMHDEVVLKDERLKELGYSAYLDQMGN